MDTCIVCLAELPKEDLPQANLDGALINYHLEDLAELLLARLPCTHVFHNGCLKPWVERANSCPVCRQTFNEVQLVACPDGRTLATYQVEDKTQMIETEDPPNSTNQEYHPVCFVCNESGYSDSLLFCSECDSPYHTYCLGIETVTPSTWRCPPCVVEQPISENYRTREPPHRSIIRSIVDPWQSAWREVAAQTDEDFLGARIRRRNSSRRSGSATPWTRRLEVARRQGTAHVLQEVIPDMQGGRAQAPIHREPVLSEEELTAWKMLEEARDLEDQDHDKAPNPPTPGSSKDTASEEAQEIGRKRRLSRISGSSPPQLGKNLAGPSSSRTSDRNPIPPESPTTERKLKRPRTRRLVTANLPQSPTRTNSPPLPRIQEPTSIALPARISDDSKSPTFLDSLLADIDKSPAPISTKDLITVTHTIPRADQLQSPVDSSAGSPPRIGSPSISDIAIGSPSASPPPSYFLEVPFTDAGHDSDSSSTARLPTPSSSPPPLSLTSKKEIEKMVRSALKTHYEAGTLSSEQFADINKSVSRGLYSMLGTEGRIREWDRARWQRLADKEVGKQVDILKRGHSPPSIEEAS